MIQIFPSLISSNLLNLQKEIELLEPYCEGFHLDVMDFHFVSNLTWGSQFINSIRAATSKTISVHLMVDYPEKYLEQFNLYKNDIISVHIESPSNVSFNQLFSNIRSLNLVPSIAIKPTTPLETIVSCPVAIEHILLMSVEPGFSGQSFLPYSINRLKALNNFRIAHNLNFTICMDGGITSHNINELIKNGADQFAIASAIFSHKDKISALKKLQKT